jgi:hypothetical protein
LPESEQAVAEEGERQQRYLDDGPRDAMRVGCMLLFFPLGLFLLTVGIQLYLVVIKPPLQFITLLTNLTGRIFAGKARRKS